MSFDLVELPFTSNAYTVIWVWLIFYLFPYSFNHFSIAWPNFLKSIMLDYPCNYGNIDIFVDPLDHHRYRNIP
jgi:hypothetical protein